MIAGCVKGMSDVAPLSLFRHGSLSTLEGESRTDLSFGRSVLSATSVRVAHLNGRKLKIDFGCPAVNPTAERLHDEGDARSDASVECKKQGQTWLMTVGALIGSGLAGCKQAPPPAPAMQALPVMVAPVSMNAVPTGDTYVATIKSRRSATMQPQVDGNLTKIYVTSGQAVKQGQLLMQIDPLKQVATVEQQAGSQAQANATYEFNKSGGRSAEEALRGRDHFEARRTTRRLQTSRAAKGAYQRQRRRGSPRRSSSLPTTRFVRRSQGIIGDIPVHQGDYVTPTTVLTTLDENGQVSRPTSMFRRSARVRSGSACRWISCRLPARCWRKSTGFLPLARRWTTGSRAFWRRLRCRPGQGAQSAGRECARGTWE